MASGAWESIVINGRRFVCKSDDSVKVQLPGYENEVLTAGDGSTYIKKTYHTGQISDINVFCNRKNNDLEFLQEQQDSMEFLPINGTELDGTVYNGEMQITEALEHDDSENTVTLTLMGKLEKQ